MRAFIATPLVIAGLALGQAAPIPPIQLSVGTTVIDGGLTAFGPTTLRGTLQADAGYVGNLYIPGSGNAAVGNVASSEIDFQEVGTTSMFGCSYATNLCTSYEKLVANNGLQVNASASTFTSMEYGSCALTSGTCNAAVANATGASLCYCDVQGGNWAVDAGSFTCHARADAGSATVWVNAGATPLPGTPTVGIHCDN